MAEIGDWVTPSWTGHSAYGQTGQIIGVSPSGAWQIDGNGDGSADFYVQNQNMVAGGSMTHQGMMGDSFMGLTDHASSVFNMVVSVVLAVVAFGIFIKFAKRVKRG
tara:strand:- start:755 stop:1072 length:318 start_codon:yes stop_codon:yes gene_type:complete